MKQISSLDLFYLTKEFKEIIENSRIETFYLEEDIFYIKIYVKGRGHYFLKNKISKYIYLTNRKEEESTIPKSFIQYLRKFLKNGIIKEIEQIENERILKIEISKKNSLNNEFEIFYLFIELFANGNIIICDKDLIIINSLQKKKFKDRKVMVKDSYVLPPQKEINIHTLDKNEDKLKQKLKESDLSIVKFIAIELGIGGKYAEEIIFNSKINKNINSNELNNEEINSIIKNSKELIERELSPSLIINEDNKIIDFEPIFLKSINKKRKELSNFNEVIKTYFKQFENKRDQKEEEFKKELLKLENRIKKQEKQREEILINYEKFNSIGNKIYENYSLIEELLNSINKTAKEKGWNFVLEKIKTNEKLNKIIKKIDPKKNEIILNLD